MSGNQGLWLSLISYHDENILLQKHESSLSENRNGEPWVGGEGGGNCFSDSPGVSIDDFFDYIKI